MCLHPRLVVLLLSFSFVVLQKESDPERLRSLYADAVKEQTVLQRSAIVNQLYGGWKVAVEVQDVGNDPAAVLDRGNN